MTLKEIPIYQHPTHKIGTIQQIAFPNGYGASIIKSLYSYGAKEGKYELAEMTHNAKLDVPTDGYHLNMKLCYEHFDDVIGFLTENEVNNYLKIIEER